MIYLFDESKTLTGTVRDEHVRSLLYDREKNGMYDISAEIPVIAYHQGNRYNLHSATKNAVFLGHYDLEGRFQLHKIAGYDVNSDTIAILGVHIFFDEAKAGAIIKDRRYIDREISDGARDAFAEIGWQMADFDVSPQRTYNFYNVSPLEARAILIETFGFEFDYWIDFDGKKISGKYFSVKKQIGQDVGKRYTYDKHTNTGHHVLELTAETDYSEVFTAVIGRGRGEEIEETGGYGRRIEYTDIEWSKPNRPLNKPKGSRVLIDPEATQAFGYVQEDGTITPRTAVVVFNDIEKQSELLEASYDWLVEHRHPKLVFDVNVADGDGLELGDTVHIKYNEISLNMAVRVGKVTDDLKSGERQVQLGDVAYFKPGRSNRDIKRSIRQERRDANNRIYQLKLEFDERFDGEVNQMREDFEQELIDVNAEIEAAEQRHEDRWQEMDADINQNIEKIVGGSIESLDTTLLDVNSRLLSKLDTSDLQPLQSRIDEAFSDISDVSGDLNTARTELQKQLDDADSAIDAAGDKIEAAEVRITNAEGKLVTNDQNIADAQERLTQAEQDISEHGTDIESANTRLDETETEIGGAKTRITAAETQLGEHGSKIEAQGVEITNIEGQLSSKAEQSELDALEGTVSKHTTEISQNATDISSKANQSEVDTLSGTVSEHSTSINQNAESITSKADASVVDALNDTVTSQGTLLSQTAEELKSKANQALVDTLNGTVTSHTTLITQNAEAIESKANQSLVDTLNNTVSDHTTLITQNATDISSKAESSVVDSLDDTVSEHSTQISQNASAITSKADASDVNTLQGTVSEHSTQISQNATDIESKAEQSEVDTISGTVSDHSTQISQNATDIRSKADSTTVDSIGDTVTSHSTLISQNATDIQSKADTSVVDSLTGTVSDHSTEISQNAQAISSKADQSIVDTLSGTVSDHESRITQNAKGIESKVSSEELRAEIDGIEVGTRNIVLNSDFDDGKHSINFWRGSNSPDSYDEILQDPLHGNVYKMYRQTSFDSRFDLANQNFNVGEIYTLSYLIKGKSRVRHTISQSNNASSAAGRYYVNVDSEDEWKKVEVPLEIIRNRSNNDGTQYLKIDPTTDDSEITIDKIMLVKGNKSAEHQLAPEDNEAKITDINTTLTSHDTRITQTAEAITSKADKSVVDALSGTVGEHSTTIMQTAEELQRKAETSVVDAISGTVENNTLTITETAKDVSSLIEKTELHDGDITQWSNETQSNAEEIGRTLTRISEIDGDIERAQTEISANADGISGLLTRTSETEDAIADINLSVDGITADFANYRRDVDSDVGALSTQIASYEASVDGFRADVGQIEDDMLNEFSIVNQRFDNITSTVQNLNLNTRNMLMGSDFENPDLVRTYTNVDILSRDVGKTIRLGRPGGNEGMNTATFMFEESITLEKDEDYYFVIDYMTYSTPELDYMTINTEDGDWVALHEHGTAQEGLVNLIDDGTWRKGVMHIRPTSTLAGTLRVGTRFNRGVEGVWIEVKRPYLTNTLNREWVPHPRDGQNVDELVDRITQVEQTSESIRAHVQEISNDALMQSDFVLQSDGFFLGGKYVGGDHYSTAIVGSRDGIDILASRMRVTGDLLVRGDVESYALSAVHGDITNLRSKLLTANVVQSSHLRVDSALANKFNSNTAFIDRLEVKAANIRDLDVIDIHANTFSSSVSGSNREITMYDGRARFRYGAIEIETTSGRRTVIDGYLNRSSSLIAREPGFMNSSVSIEGQWFRVNSTSYRTAHLEHYIHEARYLEVSVAINRWGQSGEIVDARMETGNGKISNFFTSHGNGGDGTHYGWLEIDLGEPLDRPTTGSVQYKFKNRHGLTRVAMHLGNRFLTDFPDSR